MVTLWNRADHYIFILWFLSSSVFTGSIARSTSGRYLIYSEADFEVFCPTGATHIAPKGLLLHAKFHPHRCNDKGVEPLKLEFFTQI